MDTDPTPEREEKTAVGSRLAYQSTRYEKTRGRRTGRIKTRGCVCGIAASNAGAIAVKTVAAGGAPLGLRS